MLPLLKLLEFSRIIPLSYRSIEKITFHEGVNKFLAENGAGKTTLTDLIEHSLVRDAHAFAWNVFSKKRVDKSAYVKAEWLFGTENNIITHEFTDAGARTRVTSAKFSNKALTREMYSTFLHERANLTLEELQKVFSAIYYKRENDLNLLGTPGEEDLMDFFELLNKAVRMETPETIKLRNQIGEIKRQIELRKNSKKKLEATLEKMEMVFASAESSAEAIDALGARSGELERDNIKLREETEALRTAMRELEEEDQQILDKLDNEQETLLEKRLRKDSLQAQKFSQESKLRQLEKELEGFKKLGTIDYQAIKLHWKEKQFCELCGSSIYEHWNDRIVSGCPSCGTAWKNIPKTVREAVSFDQGELAGEARNIRKEIEKISHELRTTEEDFEKTKKEEQGINELLKSLREQLAVNNSRRRKLQQQNDEINQKIQRIGMELGSLSAQQKMISQDESIGLLKVNLEKVKGELDDYQIQLERLERQLPEQEELQQILNNFARSTKEIFGYSMLADTDTRRITISKDGSVRDFAVLSWSERYFIDVVLRIAIFNFLINNGIIRRGMVVLDSPEAALDPHRLQLLAKLVNRFKEKINFVVATRVKEFYDLLEGHALEIKRETQMSLFDFIKS